MKLIDLLVQELPKRGGWPEGSLSITQDNDGSLCVWDTNDPHYDGLSWKHHTGNSLMYFWHGEGAMPLSSDHKESIVTYWQYKAALYASQKPAWNGEGLPPVGMRCEIVDPDGVLMYGQGESGEVISHVENTAVIRMSYGLGCFEARFLRPLRTEAERKRDAAIEAMQREADDGDNWIYSEHEIIYDAIAAGKIPGVKLED